MSKTYVIANQKVSNPEHGVSTRRASFADLGNLVGKAPFMRVSLILVVAVMLSFAFLRLDTGSRVTFALGDTVVANMDISRGANTVTLPTMPNRIGYTFLGWYRDAEFTRKFNVGDRVGRSSTFHARVARNHYTITLVDPSGNFQPQVRTLDFGTQFTFANLFDLPVNHDYFMGIASSEIASLAEHFIDLERLDYTQEVAAQNQIFYMIWMPSFHRIQHPGGERETVVIRWDLALQTEAVISPGAAARFSRFNDMAVLADNFFMMPIMTGVTPASLDGKFFAFNNFSTACGATFNTGQAVNLHDILADERNWHEIMHGGNGNQLVSVGGLQRVRVITFTANWHMIEPHH